MGRIRHSLGERRLSSLGTEAQTPVRETMDTEGLV